jgi:hypothetical protein
MRPAAIRGRLAVALAISLIAGIAIGWMDSRPGFDDTGVTAVSLVLAAGAASFVADRSPWLLAVTTGVWVPLFEQQGLAPGGPLLALAFSGVGSAAGWFAAHR